MGIRKYKPTSAGRRNASVSDFAELTPGAKPEKSLLRPKKRTGGRNNQGKITARHRGGGHKRRYRLIDFRRNKDGVLARVASIQYDPNRSANIALLQYEDGEKAYILAPKGLKAGDKILSSNQPQEAFTAGLALPLKLIPPSTFLHAIEMQPGKGAQIARSAGQSAQLISIEGNRATLKMPSGEIRMLNADCRATIGRVGNEEHESVSLGKAGRKRWKGRRPRVRGVAMNPVDHPMGGGEAKTSGGGHPVSPWGQLAKGYPTRTKSKPSNAMILVRRNGKKVKKR